MAPHSTKAEKAVAVNPLLETKLYIPAPRPGLVSRPRLVERLQQGIDRKLTLISAPAGFGKTTLLAEWLAANPALAPATGWLSLDENDNEPALFLAYLITALQKVWPTAGKDALAGLQTQQPLPIESILTHLINEIDALGQDAPADTAARGVLVLDDYHVIDAQPVHHAMTFLLDHLPPCLHLIIASRSDPPLPLPRLRARNESTELRATDLRFTRDEAAAFLSKMMGLTLSAADVAALEARTEGWVAGLQLAALSMQGRDDIAGFIAAFTGNDRYIVDYLVEEVLQRQPDHVRTFLFQTSILDRLSGPLCDAVTGRDDGQMTLQALERGNLFVIPIDNMRQWYRYHHLFADVLRAHARVEQRERLPALHRRAAAWFEAQGMVAEAIEQARAASDHETVARLLAANFDEFERSGRYASVSRWAASLPDEMVRKRPRLALIYASIALRIDDNNQAARKLTSWADEAINTIEASGPFDPANDPGGTVVGAAGLDALKGEMLAMKLFTTARTLPAEEIAAIASQALALLPPSRHRIRGMLRMVDTGMKIVRGNLREALPNLERSVSEARQVQNPPLLVDALTQCGQAYVALGMLEEARQSLEEALQVGQTLPAESIWVLCSPHTSLAAILLERGDLAGAQDHAARALDFAGMSPTRSPVLYARTTAAEVLLAAGDIGSAMAQLAQAQAFVRGSSDSRYFSFLASVQLRLLCLTGDLTAASEIVRERGLSPETAINRKNEEEMTAYARYLVARGDYRRAERVLSRVLPTVQITGHVQHEIEVLVLHAVVNEQLGEREAALAALGRATLLAEPGQFTRTFTHALPGSEDSVMAELLGELVDAIRRGREPGEAGSMAHLTYLQREMRQEGALTRVASPAGELVESLTARELEILRLIAAGMRNQEIADHLFISLHTVKRHIANAYGKLAVTHRTEAVARATELQLL